MTREEANEFVESLMDKLSEEDYDKVCDLRNGYVANLINGATEKLLFSNDAYIPMVEALDEWSRKSLIHNETITIGNPRENENGWFELSVQPTNLSFLFNFARLYGEKIYIQKGGKVDYGIYNKDQDKWLVNYATVADKTTFLMISEPVAWDENSWPISRVIEQFPSMNFVKRKLPNE